MKIEVKHDKNVALFGDIDAGDVFRYNGYYYIKVSSAFRIEGANYSAISLDDGEPILFHNDEKVFVPSAKLVIE